MAAEIMLARRFCSGKAELEVKIQEIKEKYAKMLEDYFKKEEEYKGKPHVT